MMSDALWNVNGSLDTQELVAQIKASVRQRQGLRCDSVEGAGMPTSLVTEPSEGDAVASVQAEINQALLRALDLVTRHLEHLQMQIEMVDAWVREETEQTARCHQEVNEQMNQLICQLADLDTRIDALEGISGRRKRKRRESWSRFAGLDRSSR